MKIFMIYKLRQGITKEEYRKWSLERDQPTLTGREGINEYRVFDVEGVDGPDSFEIIEYVNVENWDVWKKVTTTGPMVPIGDDFARLVDVDSVVALRGEEIE
jgi:hypothetical protein